MHDNTINVKDIQMLLYILNWNGYTTAAVRQTSRATTMTVTN